HRVAKRLKGSAAVLAIVFGQFVAADLAVAVGIQSGQAWNPHRIAARHAEVTANRIVCGREEKMRRRNMLRLLGIEEAVAVLVELFEDPRDTVIPALL